MDERPSITFQERNFGARLTSAVLKGFAALWIMAGVVAIYNTDVVFRQNGTRTNALVATVAIEIGATLLGAAVFAFFAYALDLLRGIWEEVAGENE